MRESIRYMKGDLKLHNVAAILLTVSLHRLDGCLEVEQKNVCKKLFFDKGNITFAASNQFDDRLGDILLAEGKITQAQYDLSVAELKKGKKRQGAILVQFGILTTHELILAIRRQITKILYSIIRWDSGEYRFDFLEEAIKESVTLRENMLNLMQKTLEEDQDTSWFDKSISDIRTIFTINNDAVSVFDSMTLTPNERKMYHYIYEGQRSMQNICDWSEFEPIETIKGIQYLIDQNLLTMVNTIWDISN